MKRFIIIIPLIFFLLVSCQQNIEPDHAEIPVDEVLTRALSTGKVSPDDPIVFLPATNMKAWTSIGPLEERFAASEVPASRLTSMTTEALVKSMMNYPLNYLVFAYNDPKMAIDIIVKHSPLHKEFLSRPDAAEVFVDMYAAADLDMSLEKSNFDGDYKSLSYTNTIFMDHFLGSQNLNGLGQASVKQKLTEAVREKLQARIQTPETFSMFSVEPLIIIDEKESLSVVSDLNTRSLSYTVNSTYTALGHLIEYLVIEEMTADEMEDVTNDLVTQYPNAIVRGASTYDYNCHSYAWLDQSIENNMWLNYKTQSNAFQLSRFWTDDAYVGCSEADAEIVYYSSGDHSAVKLPNGNYISKWGRGPLMEHSPTYSPYISTNRQYYQIRKTPLYGELTILGEANVSVNQRNNYQINRYCPKLSYSWVVRYNYATSPTPFFLDIYGDSCSLTCQEYGLYNTSAYGYYKGFPVVVAEINIIAGL